MSRIVFDHADKDLVFTVSPLHWDEQRTLDGIEPQVLTLPLPSAGDVGKFLVIGNDGQPHYTAVKPGAVDFHTRTFVVTGQHGDPVLNLNNLDHPLIVHPSELVFVKDNESGDTFIFVGGEGSFGTRAGGTTVTNDMFSKVETGPLDVDFATQQEVRAKGNPDKALNPENVQYIDVDGGTF